MTIAYGSGGTQLVDDTTTDWGTGSDEQKAVQYWRDPLVVSAAGGASGAGFIGRDHAERHRGELA